MSKVSKPLQYIQRTRNYYQKLGYGEPYSWAHFSETPFSKLRKPLSACTVTIVTTAAPYQSDKGDQGPGAPYNSAAKFFEVYSLPTAEQPDLRISHIAIDRDHTRATDQNAYFPLLALSKAVDHGIVGQVSNRFHGLPTNRSKRTTLNVDCESLLQRCTEDQADIVLLLPNCPVCHQSVALAARTLEQAGIVTVIMGCAKDIIEHVGVPRFLFNDFPLGNAAGRPHDTQCQFDILVMALELAASATHPETTIQSPFQWSDDDSWKEDYSNPDKLSEAQIKERREAFDAAKQIARETKANKGR